MGRGTGTNINSNSGVANLRAQVAAPTTTAAAERLAYFSRNKNILKQNTDQYNEAFEVVYNYNEGFEYDHDYESDDERDYYDEDPQSEDQNVTSGALLSFDPEAFAENIYQNLRVSVRKNFSEANRFAKLKAGETVRDADLDTKAIAAREYYHHKENNQPESDWRTERDYPEDFETGVSITEAEIRAWKNPRVLEEYLCERIKEGQQDDTDKKVLQAIVEAENIDPDSFIVTKTFDFYGDVPGPVLLKEEPWNNINEKYEDYLNSTTYNTASVNDWLAEKGLTI